MEKCNSKIKITLGVACALMYAFMYQFGDMFYKYTYNHSKVESLEANLLRYTTSFVIISSHMLADRRSLQESKANTFYLILAGILRASGSILFQTSLKLIDMGTSAVITATLPPVSIVFAWLLLKEKTKLSECLLGILSYVGVFMVVWTRLEAPKPDPHSYAIGTVYGFTSMICFSLYYITTRKVSGKSDLRRSLFYINFAGVATLLLTQLITKTDIVLTQVPIKFSLLLLTGGVVFFLALIMEVVSLKFLNVGVIMIIRNTDFIWAYLYDIIFDGVYPSFVIILGILIIVLSASLIAVDSIRNIPYVKGFKLLISKICSFRE